MRFLEVFSTAPQLLQLLYLLYIINFASCELKEGFLWSERECPGEDDKILAKQVPWGVKGRAYLTVPPGLRIAPSKIKGAGFGVLSDMFIPKHTWLGEYDGEIVPPTEKKQISWYTWSALRASKRISYIDALHLHTSSYHRYVNTPIRHRDENVLAKQCYGRIYYITSKDIIPGEELLVFYGFQYSITLKIDLNDYYEVAERLRIAGLNLNNETHRQWVVDTGYKLPDMKKPSELWLSILRAKLGSQLNIAAGPNVPVVHALQSTGDKG